MVMVQLCQEFIEALKKCGPAIIADRKIIIYLSYSRFKIYTNNINLYKKDVDQIAQNILSLYEKKAVCQLENDDEELLDEDEEAEYDALLISTASDLVAALAFVLGPGFASYFKVYLPHITK